MARYFNFNDLRGLMKEGLLRDNNKTSIPFPVKDQTINGTNSAAPWFQDTLNGGSGNDTISGFAGVNNIDGRDGNDRIVTGFWGNSVDNVTGGRGNDTFEVAFEFDSYDISNRNPNGSSVSVLNVSDFTAGEDKLHFQNTNLVFSDLDTNGDGVIGAGDASQNFFASQDERGLHLSFTDGHFINLAGVSSLTANDVTFASTMPVGMA